jgi:type I restriction-modification system DNA methylase subunit
MNGENMAKTKENNNNEPIEKQLWKAADKLRKNIDAAEYKHIVLGLIFWIGNNILDRKIRSL